MNLNWRKIIVKVGILIPVIVISGLAGSYIALYYLTSFNTFAYHKMNAAVIEEEIATLSNLRGGKVDKAIERLEIYLDGRLMTYSSGIQQIFPSPEFMNYTSSSHAVASIGKDIERALAHAKDYRLKYPRTTTQPEIDRDVAQALMRTNVK